MNKLYTKITQLGMVSLLLFLLSALTLAGQTPTTFNYQAVLRDATGHIQVSESVSLQLVIHQGTITGTTVYSEVHNTTTTEFGLVNLEVGSVTPASFATIDWSARTLLHRSYCGWDFHGRFGTSNRTLCTLCCERSARSTR